MFCTLYQAGSLILTPLFVYWGLAAAAVVLLVTMWAGHLKRKMPFELWGASCLLAAVCASVGFAFGCRWHLEAESVLQGELTEGERQAAAMLLKSPVYLAAIGLEDLAAAQFIRNALTVLPPKRGATVFALTQSGFSWNRPEEIDKWTERFMQAVEKDLSGICFTSRLLAAGSSEVVISAIKNGPPPVFFRKPVRLLLREHLPELKERFTEAGAALTALGQAVGGGR